jgi:peptidoglycan/xylan/chitin deacetylase (PgdA/CDA1 family)
MKIKMKILIFAIGFAIVLSSVVYQRPCGYVSITFDDGYKSQLAASRTLDGYGFKGTFYIIGGLSTFEDHSLMSTDDILDIAYRGHEIGGHTFAHRNADNITKEEFLRDVVEGKERLEEIGMSVRSFAYPYGHGTQWEDVVREAGYANAKDGGYVSNALPLRDAYNISGVFPTHDNFPLISSYINDTQRGYWLVLGFHDIGPVGEIRPDVDITEEEFTQILNELKSSCLSVVRVGDFRG